MKLKLKQAAALERTGRNGGTATFDNDPDFRPERALAIRIVS